MKKIVKALIEEDVKNNVEQILCSYGIKTSEIIRLLFHYVNNNKRLPFDINHKETQTLFLSKFNKL